MAEDTTTNPEYRRAVVARYGPFRVDRLSFRTTRPDGRAHPDYSVVFEVDTASEFDLGTVWGILAPPDVRRFAFYLASLWWRAHSPPPESRPKSVPFYRRRVGTPNAEREGATEEWYRYQDPFFRRPDRPTIDVDEAAALIEAAMHELAETETGEGRGSTF